MRIETWHLPLASTVKTLVAAAADPQVTFWWEKRCDVQLHAWAHEPTSSFTPRTSVTKQELLTLVPVAAVQALSSVDRDLWLRFVDTAPVDFSSAVTVSFINGLGWPQAFDFRPFRRRLTRLEAALGVGQVPREVGLHEFSKALNADADLARGVLQVKAGEATRLEFTDAARTAARLARAEMIARAAQAKGVPVDAETQAVLDGLRG